MTESKVVLVTGAGGNIGRAFTAVFAREGYRVAGLDVDEGALDRFVATAEAEGCDHLPLRCDLNDWSQIEQAIDAAAQRFGRIDVVINNAVARTTPVYKSLTDCTEEEIRAVMSVGPLGALGVMRAALPHLKRVKGLVINIGSAAGMSAPANMGPYGMSKAALNLLTRIAAKEWGQFGVRVNGLLPYIMTESFASVMAANPDQFKSAVPSIGRIGDMQTDLGPVALFLASEAASYITGQNIPVDGGASA